MNSYTNNLINVWWKSG